MKIISCCVKLMLIAFIGLAASLNAKPFVVGRLWAGQLGNQFFEIAAAVSLALDNDAEAFFPDFVTNRDVGMDLQTNYKHVFFRVNATAPQEKIEACYIEPGYAYSSIPFHNNMCIQGYFQSEKYFSKHKDKILELFAPSQEICEYLQAKYAELLKHPNTVSLHVRVYYKDDPEQKIYPNYGREYFERAMMKFPEDSLFVVFSNDMTQCKDVLANIQKNIIFIEGETSYHDLYLMSMCKHNIITNSSFSWWAAYLNLNPKKIVIVPPAWNTPTCGLDYKDVVPENWTAFPVQSLDVMRSPYLLKDPEKVLYLARLHQQRGENSLALKYYEWRMKLEGTEEQLYLTMMEMAALQVRLNMPKNVIERSYETAFGIHSVRAEPLYHLASYYINHGDAGSAYRVLKMGVKIPCPEGQFVEKWLYDYGSLFLFSICAHNSGQYKDALQAYDDLLANPVLPENYRTATVSNRKLLLTQVNDPRFVKFI